METSAAQLADLRVKSQKRSRRRAYGNVAEGGATNLVDLVPEAVTPKGVWKRRRRRCSRTVGRSRPRSGHAEGRMETHLLRRGSARRTASQKRSRRRAHGNGHLGRCRPVLPCTSQKRSRRRAYGNSASEELRCHPSERNVPEAVTPKGVWKPRQLRKSWYHLPLVPEAVTPMGVWKPWSFALGVKGRVYVPEAVTPKGVWKLVRVVPTDLEGHASQKRSRRRAYGNFPG